jgi:DNA-directed RNA polymerase specialized sigma24 family protein
VTTTPATGEARQVHGESEWVEAIRAGDAAAFEAMFHQYHAPFCSFAHRYLGARDLAEEMVQEVFLSD